jgi:hypothetical protein
MLSPPQLGENPDNSAAAFLTILDNMLYWDKNRRIDTNNKTG